MAGAPEKTKTRTFRGGPIETSGLAPFPRFCAVLSRSPTCANDAISTRIRGFRHHVLDRRRDPSKRIRRTAGVDVKHPLPIAALDASIGRKVSLRVSPRERPESLPKLSFRCERERRSPAPPWRRNPPPGFIRPCEPWGYRTSSRRPHPVRVNPSPLQLSLPTP
jgi:hypothetical protein